MVETIVLNKKGLVEPFYQDNHIRVYNKDCRSMDELPDGSVQCVVTSPPYWGLRKYAGEQDLIWGGDKDCKHKFDMPTMATLGFNTLFRPEGETSTPLGLPSDKGKYAKTVKGGADRQQKKAVGNFCSLCGAWKGAYGLEPTPEMYIEHTIEILREIRRVLRKDGVVFWNIGDSYATHASGGKEYSHNFRKPEVAISQGIDQPKPPAKSHGLKEKDLCLIPFRVAISAQEDGWWVRSVIIWSKQNPMPESVTDRPTESHEYILMLTKSARYYWDQEAVREPYSPTERWGGDTYKGAVKKGTHGEDGGLDRERSCFPDTGRNIRSVWTFPTVPFPSFKIDGRKVDHFAVFPEKLPQLCIKAATPEVGCCAMCGAPWARVIERHGSGPAKKERKNTAIRLTRIAGQEWQDWKNEHPDKTVGWRPSCKCNAPWVPSLVLDPLMGAGTTLEEAKNLNRYAAGYELAEEYCQLAVERCRQQILV